MHASCVHFLHMRIKGFGIFGVAIVTSFPVYCMLLTDRISILAGGNNYLHNLIKNIFLIIWIFP